MSEERLQKILARAGIASRRRAEELITAGRVSVDGRVVTELGVRADPKRARVEVDGRRVVHEPFVYIILHKPRGVVSTMSDPERRPTVAELVRVVGVRAIPVGRLDFHTSGALLMTNDGEFASALGHPSRAVPKVYVAKVKGKLKESDVLYWRQSIVIDGRPTRPAEVRLLRHEGDKTWLQITLQEGRNRQVRRLGDESGFPVMRLARLAQAGITTEGLRPGQWRHLTVDELTGLKKQWGVPRRVKPPTAPGHSARPRVVQAASRPGPAQKRGRTSRH